MGHPKKDDIRRVFTPDEKKHLSKAEALREFFETGTPAFYRVGGSDRADVVGGESASWGNRPGISGLDYEFIFRED